MEYEVALERVPGDVFVIDSDMVTQSATGTLVAVSIVPGGAAIVPDAEP